MSDITSPSRELMYHESPEALRRELVKQANESNAIVRRVNAQESTSKADKDLLFDNLAIIGLAYNLAGLIGWIGREFGDDAMVRAARLMDDSLMNGDFEELNADLGVPTVLGASGIELTVRPAHPAPGV